MYRNLSAERVWSIPTTSFAGHSTYLSIGETVHAKEFPSKQGKVPRLASNQRGKSLCLILFLILRATLGSRVGLAECRW
jgi:hypothetical protein